MTLNFFDLETQHKQKKNCFFFVKKKKLTSPASVKQTLPPSNNEAKASTNTTKTKMFLSVLTKCFWWCQIDFIQQQPIAVTNRANQRSFNKRKSKRKKNWPVEQQCDSLNFFTQNCFWLRLDEFQMTPQDFRVVSIQPTKQTTMIDEIFSNSSWKSWKKFNPLAHLFLLSINRSFMFSQRLFGTLFVRRCFLGQSSTFGDVGRVHPFVLLRFVAAAVGVVNQRRQLRQCALDQRQKLCPLSRDKAVAHGVEQRRVARLGKRFRKQFFKQLVNGRTQRAQIHRFETTQQIRTETKGKNTTKIIFKIRFT